MKLLQITFVMALALFYCVSVCEAATIGINHVGPGDGQWGSDGIVSPVTSPAGVVVQSNWNNIENASGSADDLIDSDGNTTTLDVEWSSELGTWDTGGPMTTGNEQLMHGYLDADDYGALIRVSDLPPELVAVGYDIYVYHESQGGDGGIGVVRLFDGPPSLPIDIWAKDMAGTFDGVFVEDGYASQAEAEAGDGGNYVVFRGVSLGEFQVVALGVTGTPRMPIQGIQIVPIPEPSSLVLAAIGLLSLALIGWRRRTA